jgi:hypothetical protein
MDKALLMFRGGVRSAKRKLADGNEHSLHFKAKTPNEIALFLGSQNRISDDEAGDIARQDLRAKFIATSLCHEDGSLLMTEDEAKLIPATLKPQLCEMILLGSNEIGDAGKG